jgi:hypothetical protein
VAGSVRVSGPSGTSDGGKRTRSSARLKLFVNATRNGKITMIAVTTRKA